MLLFLVGIRTENEVLRSHQRHDRQKQGDGERTQQDICLRECPARTDRSGWPDHMDMVHELSPSKWSAPTSNARREPPHDPAGCRLAALVVVERFTPLKEKICTCRANRGASSRKKRKTLFLGQKRCFSLMRPAFSRPLRQGGVERIAPGAGAIRPRGWGKSLHPPREVVFARMSQREGLAGVRKVPRAEGLRSLGATLPAPPGRGFRRCPRRDRPGRPSTAAQTAAVR